MQRKRLEKWQWNTIIEAVAEAGLDRRDFDFDDDGDEARIRLRGSDSVFVVGRDRRAPYAVSRAVGEQSPVKYAVNSWTGVQSPPLYLWLNEVKRDLDTPDLLAEVRQEREMLTVATEDVENTPFTADEQAAIAKQLEEIKEYAKRTLDLSADQTRALEAGLDEIRDVAGRLGRREWLTYVAGTLTILGATVLSPETTHHIFVMLLQSLVQLKGHTFPALPGSH